MTQFETALSSFKENLETLFSETKHPFVKNNYDVSICFEHGRKYIKALVQKAWNSGYTNSDLYCFIDKTTGDILKPASWKAPAKHARGNIFSSDSGMSCCTRYGVKYLK